MSADLWAAFSADDLSGNPWTQPSSDQTSAQKASEAEAAERSTDIPVSRTEALPVRSPTEQQQTQTPWDISEEPTPTFKAPVAQNLSSRTWDTLGEDEELWSGWESPSVSAESWAKINAYPDALPPTVDPTDEPSPVDDWGDFETPANEHSRGIAALSAEDDSKPPSRSDKALSTERFPLEKTPHPRGQILEDHDPYADPESLNSQRPVEATVKESKTARLPKVVYKRGLQLTDEVIPYSQEEWGEFSPEPANSHLPDIATSIEANVQTNNRQPIKPRTISPTQSTHRKQESTRRVGMSTSALPPSNVPPPSILISLVSALVEKLPVQVENTMHSITESGGSSRVLETALRKCIASLRVAARITAGRKLRWRRDTHLAQSMRIGQAGKGMKLSGVDRNEVKKEDREAAEFVHIWQKHLGSIRKALALVNSQVAVSPLALPEIAGTMAIRTIKVADGGISAPKCCVICGIKREERVDKVDVDVYDAFSEWWTDHWGHTECRLFWTEYEQNLLQR